MISWIYRKFLKPILFKFDPEDVHDFFLRIGNFLGRFALTRKFTALLFHYQNSVLEQIIAGIRFQNPVGLSAGFDKNADIIDILPSIGFGFAQVGTVTYKAYGGNPRPRLSRLPKSQSLRVYYGLKNLGVDQIAERIRTKKVEGFPLSISIGKTNSDYTSSDEAGIQDYYDCLKSVINYAIGDFYTINVSCPNTFGGEPFTSPNKLMRLMDKLSELEIDKPVFVKMPLYAWSEFEPLLDVLVDYEFVTGVVVANLEKDRSNPEFELVELKQLENIPGGLSGRPLFEKCKELVSHSYDKYSDRLVIIAVGGIFSADDAIEMIRSGASLVQLITGMVFNGPGLIKDINRGLVMELQRNQLSSVSEMIGSDHRLG